MASLTNDEASKVAHLAKLDLSKDEIEKFKVQLSEIISYINQLQEVDTSSTEPTSQTTGLTSVTRDDTIDPNRLLTPNEATSGTEKIHNNYFVVPALIKRDE